MSRPQAPQPAKLIISGLLREKGLMEGVVPELERAFGPLDVVGPWLEFNFTDYYAPEMGTPLFRRMLVFANLIEQEALADIKCRTNAIEMACARDAKRRINLDPGYLLYERFVLATGKNYAHRIYIGKGIYADLTLIFQQGQYQPLAWTYPDYADQGMRSFLLQLRQKYADDLKLVSNKQRVVRNA